MITIGWSHFNRRDINHSNVSNLHVWATVIGSHSKKEPTASPVLTKWWKLELTLATNFGSHAQMVTKFGGQILANKFGFVPDCLMVDGWSISCETALILMSQDFIDDQSTWVQIMAWCRQATSHYLSQCWPRSLSPYGVISPQWVTIGVLQSLNP